LFLKVQHIGSLNANKIQLQVVDKLFCKQSFLDVIFFYVQRKKRIYKKIHRAWVFFFCWFISKQILFQITFKLFSESIIL